MTITSVWLPKDLLLKAKQNHLNLSQLLKRIVIEELEKKGIEVDIEVPELVLKVRCPNCGNIQPTTSTKRVRCFKCEKLYSIYTKKGKATKSNIVTLLHGSMALLHKRYYEKYKKRIT